MCGWLMSSYVANWPIKQWGFSASVEGLETTWPDCCGINFVWPWGSRWNAEEGTTIIIVSFSSLTDEAKGSFGETFHLRPTGSDPGVVCQKNSFSKVTVSLSGFGPSVARGKLSVRGRCVQATNTKAETCSLLDAIGRRAAPQGTGYKKRRLENPTVYWVWNCRSVFLLALQVSLGTLRLSLFCMHRGGCSEFYCDLVTPAESFVSPLSESSPSPRKY